jgi:hypothetical protein
VTRGAKPVRRPRGRADSRRRPRRAAGFDVQVVGEVSRLRQELARVGGERPSLRWNADPDDVQRSVVHLVLTLVEFIRRLLERQAIRRMDAGTLTEDETERIGRALMQLEETVRDLAARFDIDPETLQLDLGPAGRLI